MTINLTKEIERGTETGFAYSCFFLLCLNKNSKNKQKPVSVPRSVFK